MSVQSYSYSRQGNQNLSHHFKVKEFASIGNGKLYSDTVLIDTDLVAMLEKLYSAVSSFGYNVSGIYITSGYRTAACDKAVGGSGNGQHVLGKAADIMIRVNNSGTDVISVGRALWLSGKRICCLAQDLGFTGIGYIGGRAVHCDTRLGKWYGDETNGNNNVGNFYNYFGLTNPNATLPSPNVKYCVYANGKWLGSVMNYSDYAGIEKCPISGLSVDLDRGSIKYQVHLLGGGWCTEVTDNKDYAGVIGKSIDAVRMYLVGLDGYSVIYRVSNTTDTGYYSEVKDSTDYAGCFGKPIDKIQIKIVKK